MPRARPADVQVPQPPVEPRFAVVSKSTLPEEITNRLLRQIREQQLRPGDKLPAERHLAEMMEVSRPVVREALRALALMRVVDIRQGDGTYVTSLEPQQLIAHLDLVFSNDTVGLVQLLEARRVLETANARLAALRATDAHLDELERLVRAMADAIDDPERFSELDIATHAAVCEAADNVLLLRFMDIVSTLGRASRERTGGLRTVREAALRDHRRLVRALRARDAEGAERAMVEHLDHVERGLHAALRAKGADKTASPTATAAATGPAARAVAGGAR